MTNLKDFLRNSINDSISPLDLKINELYSSITNSRIKGAHITHIANIDELFSNIYIGKVAEAYPTINAYIVFPLNKNTPVICSLLSTGSSSSIFGTKDTSSIALGSIVLFILDYTKRGYILGSIYSFINFSEELLGSRISKYSLTVGDFSSYISLLKDLRAEIYGAFNSDSYAAGEFCKNTSNGSMIFLDTYLALLRASELCGVFAFHSDNLLRLICENYDFWAPYFFDIMRRDCFYYNDTPDPFTSISEVIRELGIKDYHFINFSNLDSISEKIVHEGAIPSIYKEFIKTYTSSGYEKVLEIHKDATGQYLLNSLRGICLLQAYNNLIPERDKDPENLYGDTINNYDIFSLSLFDSLQIPSSYTPDLKDKVSIHASGIIDKLNFLINEDLYRRYRQHVKDFESFSLKTKINIFKNPNSTTPQTFSFPKKFDTTGISEFADVEVNQIPSFITTLEDGTIVIGNGYGCEIRIEKDKIYIRAPQVHLQSGDKLSIWGANGMFLRSDKEVQIVSSTDDIAIKARKYLKMCGGQFDETGESPDGGVLLVSYGNSLILANHKNEFMSPGSVSGDYISYIAIRPSSIKIKASNEFGVSDNSSIQLKSKKTNISSDTIDCNYEDLSTAELQFYFKQYPNEIFPDPLWHQIYVLHGIPSSEWKEYPDPISNTYPWNTNDLAQMYIQQLSYTADLNTASYGEVSTDKINLKWPKK